MDKRFRLGLVYLWDETWLGGVYYVQNLLKALNTLDDSKKPLVHVYCLNDKAYDSLKNSTNYAYLEKTIVKIVLWKKMLRFFFRLFSSKRADDINVLNHQFDNDDVVYPWSEGTAIDKMIYWQPDFQAKHMPEMFKQRELKNRDNFILSCCRRGIPIVFSSFDAQNDFFKFFPCYKEHPTFVIHFATSQPQYSDVDIEIVKRKYDINKKYFLCANQFWKHKNHMFMFNAFKKALDRGLDMQLVCAGRMSDYRNPEYIKNLNDFILSNHLETKILTLGIIDRKDLFCLIKQSYAVIQPSLFEGWNTTVEDCKAMNKFVFLSDIKVHREQMNKNVCFFNPYREDDLAGKLLSVTPYEENYDYFTCIKEFGEQFYDMLMARTSL